MKQRSFTITNSAGEKLACVEALPHVNPAKPLPVVIMCHGFAYFKEEDGIFTSLAERLTAIGYGVYYFDFSGCGESEGDYEQTSLTKLVNDYKALHAEVTTYDYIDATRLSLIGQSFGTNVCIAAQQLKAERVVLCGAFGNTYELLSGLFPDFDETRVVVRDRSDGRKTSIGPQFWKDIKRYDLNTLVANYSCPILFVHGEHDNIVPITEGRKLMSHAKNAKMEVIEKSNHGLIPGRQQAFDVITEFFSQPA